MTELEKSEKDAKRASVNLVLMGVLHLLFAFFASLGYAIYLDYWKPFWIATFIWVISTVTSLVLVSVLGLLLWGTIPYAESRIMLLLVPIGFIPPIVSFLMFRARVLALRDRTTSL